MKIAFAIATRGNPKRAAAVIECARSLSSGKHNIEYIVGYDADDEQTGEWFKAHYPDVLLSVGPRPLGVGAVWNRCVSQVPDADVYCPFPDDCFIASPEWDDVIALFMEAAFPVREIGVMAWNDIANPNQCSLPIVTKEWLSLTGQLYDDRFPFWFYDTCVDEVWSFITGRNVPIVNMTTLVAKKGLTKRMRDLGFWWDFYVATRPERLKKAAEIRVKLGANLEPIKLASMIRRWAARDVEGRKGIRGVEAMLAHKGHPGPEYMEAKTLAEKYMVAA